MDLSNIEMTTPLRESEVTPDIEKVVPTTTERRQPMDQMEPGKNCDPLNNSEGSPVRYLLRTDKKDLNGNPNIRKWSFGERDPRKRNRTILLVGESRTGKTTLINSLINYIIGVRKKDNVWFEISENNEDDQTTTECITVYEVSTKTSPIAWSIIDTPGFARGLEYDQKIVENLYTLFSCYDGIHSIDAVGLVVKASQFGLHDRQLYIFEVIQSLFGQNVKTNMVAFITHADERIPQNTLRAIEKASIPISKDKNNEPVYFLYDNFQSNNNCNSPNSNAYDELYSAKWEMGQRSTEHFLTFLDTLETQTLKKSEDVLKHHQKLRFSVSKLAECIQCIDRTKEELQKIKEEIEKIKAKKEDVQREGEENDTITNSCCKQNKVTFCKDCKTYCHPNCTGINNPRWCKVMKRKRCTKCPGRCSHNKHVILNEMSLKTNYKEKEMEYDMQHREKEEKEKQEEAELRKKENEKSELLDKTYNYIIKLEEIAMQSQSIFTLQHLDFLIEKMKETDNTERVQKLKELNKKDEQKEKALSYLRYIKIP